MHRVSPPPFGPSPSSPRIGEGCRPLLVAALLLPLLAAAPLEGQLLSPRSGMPQSAQDRDPSRIVGGPEDARASVGGAGILETPELQRFESTNLHEILRDLPGLQLREEDGLGVFPRIGLRASASGRSDRVTILEDGIPGGLAPYANAAVPYLPTLPRMGGFELLTGPEILRHGPQTTAGAINLLSTPIPTEAGGFVNVESGAWNSRRIHSWVGGTFGSFGVLAETYQNRTDGFHRVDRSNGTAGADIADYLLKFRWSLGEGTAVRQALELRLFKGGEEAEVSHLGLTDADFRADPDRRYGLSEGERMSRGRESASLRHRLRAGSAFSIVTTGYFVDSSVEDRRLDQINGIPLGPGGITSRINGGGVDATMLQELLDGDRPTNHPEGIRYRNDFRDFLTKGIQVEAHATIGTGPFRHELIGGARWQDDRVRETAAERHILYNQMGGRLVEMRTTPGAPGEGFAQASSFWLADRIRVRGLTLLPIARHEEIRTRAEVDDPQSARNTVSRTTFGVGANLAASENWTLLAGYHEGFAPPGHDAVEGSRGEESRNIEGGIRFREIGIEVDLLGFHTEYENALRDCLPSRPCADGSTEGFQQDGAKRVHGVEAGVAAILYWGERFTLPLTVAHVWTEGEYTRSADLGSGVQEGDVLDHLPKHAGRATLGLDHEGGLSLHVALNHAEAMCVTTTCEREGVDATFLRTDRLLTADLAFSFAFTPSVALYGRVENLLDERRITHRGTDGARGNPGRFVGAGLRVRF